jgi:hypothetical protein
MKTQDSQLDAIMEHIRNKYGLHISQAMVKRLLSVTSSDHAEGWTDLWGRDADGISQAIIVHRDDVVPVLKNRR